jgi:hypothetical protein
VRLGRLRVRRAITKNDFGCAIRSILQQQQRRGFLKEGDQGVAVLERRFPWDKGYDKRHDRIQPRLFDG